MSRQKVLDFLKKSPDAYLSGEEIATHLGLSRTAVWKAVDALRKEGYIIEARTSMGYRLTGTPDALTEREIRSFLRPTQAVGRELHCMETVDSTNTYLKRLALTGAADGTVAVADSQTGGRGRMQRPFQSPLGKSTLLSVLLKPKLPPARLLPVTALCAVAISTAVERVCGVRPGIKWTNDLVLNGKKLCGILTEMALEGETEQLQYLVIGIGINVLQQPEDFTDGVGDVATSLAMELGRPVSRPRLAAAEIEELDRLYDVLKRGDTEDYLTLYRRDCVTLGKTVQLIAADGSRRTAEALDVDDEFGLVVRESDGRENVIRFGEVSVRGMYGYLK